MTHKVEVTTQKDPELISIDSFAAMCISIVRLLQILASIAVHETELDTKSPPHYLTTLDAGCQRVQHPWRIALELNSAVLQMESVSYPISIGSLAANCSSIVRLL